MKALIFGGAGFVGLNIAEALRARGDEAVLFDRSPPPVAGFEFVRCDVLEQPGLLQQADCVIWGAAITADAARDAAEPEAVIGTNLQALIPVLRGARAVGVRRVLNLSSAAAYGEAAYRDGELDEDLPPDPRSLYSLTKFASERLCSRLGEVWDLDVVSVRLSAVFGPWERAGGARDTPSPFLRLMQLSQARLARPGLRDWLYAPDAARAVLALLDAPRLAHRLYNIGPGRSFSVLDWGKRAGISCTIGVPADVDLGGSRDRAPLAVRRLEAETGFRAHFGLEESVAHLGAWARAHPGWFKETP